MRKGCHVFSVPDWIERADVEAIPPGDDLDRREAGVVGKDGGPGDEERVRVVRRWRLVDNAAEIVQHAPAGIRRGGAAAEFERPMALVVVRAGEIDVCGTQLPSPCDDDSFLFIIIFFLTFFHPEVCIPVCGVVCVGGRDRDVKRLARREGEGGDRRRGLFVDADLEELPSDGEGNFDQRLLHPICVC